MKASHRAAHARLWLPVAALLIVALLLSILFRVRVPVQDPIPVRETDPALFAEQPQGDPNPGTMPDLDHVDTPAQQTTELPPTDRPRGRTP